MTAVMISSDKRWEAIVLFSFNFNELCVETMMGHAMGSTLFKISNATLSGHVQVNSEGIFIIW